MIYTILVSELKQVNLPTVAPECKTIISLHSGDEYTDRLYSVHSLIVILRSHQGGSVHIIIIIIIMIIIKTIIIITFFF